MSLYKKDVLISETSSLTIEEAITWTVNWLSSFESDDSSDCYFADLFDSRTSQLIKVYSNKSKDFYNLSKNDYSIINNTPDTTIENRLKAYL